VTELSLVAPLIAGWIALAPPLADPGIAPNTPWARSGARSWTRCQQLDRDAERRLRGDNGTNEQDNKPERWRERAAACPGAPAVLTLTASLELTQSVDFSGLSALSEQIAELHLRLAESRQRARLLLAAAAAESQRRASPLPPMHAYLAAYAAYGLGDAAGARVQLALARQRAEVETWRLDRLEALLGLVDGDLRESLRLAHRAYLHANSAGKIHSALIWALVLDRAGATEAAHLTLAGHRSREGRGVDGLSALLPLHERIYLMALDQESRGHSSGAVTLWGAYLGLPEPHPADRLQVERRLAQLRRGGVTQLAE
jgi:hypothetical protein